MTNKITVIVVAYAVLKHGRITVSLTLVTIVIWSTSHVTRFAADLVFTGNTIIVSLYLSLYPAKISKTKFKVRRQRYRTYLSLRS